jgi:S-adenosylmethionine-dependent methyltransferase
MNKIAQGFNQGIEVWKENQAAPWGRLRYTMVMANLEPHLETAQQILDVGGGNGTESILLAQRGHRVALVDFSTEMLAQGKHAIENAGLSTQITQYQADVVDLPKLFEQGNFDTALFHNVLQYVPNPAEALEAIAWVLAPNAILSFGIINPYSEVLIPALRELDLVKALDNVDTKVKQSNIFGQSHPLYDLDELKQLLSNAGFVVEHHYGVRCLCDYIADNDIKTDPESFAKLEQLEMAVRDKYPYNMIARFWHLIARRI